MAIAVVLGVDAQQALKRLEINEISKSSFANIHARQDVNDSSTDNYIYIVTSVEHPITSVYSYQDPVPTHETFTKTEQAGELTYEWRVENIEPDKNLDGTRKVELTSPNCEQLVFEIRPLAEREEIYFRLTCPEDTIANSISEYLRLRNLALNEYRQGNYNVANSHFVLAEQYARDEYERAQNTEDRKNAQMCQIYYDRGTQAESKEDWEAAYRAYDAITKLNVADNNALSRRAYAQEMLTTGTNNLYLRALNLWNEGKKMHKDAVPMFRTVAATPGIYSASAAEYVNKWTNESIAVIHKPHVFTYEWRKDVPIGFHIGKYNLHRAGGFFQLDFNSAIFDLIRGDGTYEDPETVKNIKYPEFNIAFGWTIHLFGEKSPVWINFGPGFTGKFYYGTYLEKNYPYADDHELDSSRTDEDDMKKKNFAPAISPVVGLTIKWRFLAARVSYQYRFTFKSDLSEFMETSRVSAGIGFAF